MELLIIVGLIVVNGVFALSEMALVSARKARLTAEAEDGNPRARLALDLANRPEKVLSTVQIGITLVGIFAGAFGGSTLVRPLSTTIANAIPALASSAEAISVAIVVGLTTYLSLVIGELVPKQLALKNAETISMFMARPLNWLSNLFAPLVAILNLSTNAVIRVLGIDRSEQETVTEGEIMSLIRRGIDVGVFDDAEESMVRNVMNLDEQRIGSFVTPRIDIMSLNINDSRDTIKQVLSEYPFTTYPVIEHDFDNILGIVRSKDLLVHLLAEERDHPPLHDLMLQPLFVPETVTAARLLEQFKESGIHTAIVIDEYGSHTGLIRLHDIIEQIVGDVDGGEFDDEEPDIVERDDGSYLIDGLLPMTQFSGLFDKFRVPSDEAGRYETLAGFIMERLERVPSVADSFEFQGLRFEVVDMDSRHIDKVLVTKVKSDKGQDMPAPSDT